MPLESNNVPTYKLLYAGLASDMYQTGTGNNLNVFLNLLGDLPVALSLSLGM